MLVNIYKNIWIYKNILYSIYNKHLSLTISYNLHKKYPFSISPEKIYESFFIAIFIRRLPYTL